MNILKKFKKPKNYAQNTQKAKIQKVMHGALNENVQKTN